MNVSGLSSASGAMAMSHASPMAGGKWDSQYQSAMSSVASLLGSSVPSLQSSSQSLSQLAAGKGVSESSLESAIKSGLQSAGTQLTGGRLDNIAHRVATRHHGHHRLQAAGSNTNSPDSSTSASGNTQWSATASSAGVQL